MASDNRVTMLKAAGAASAAAPYVRRIMSDDELRADLRRIVNSARHLYDQLSEEGVSKLLDDDVRKDVDRIMEAVQGAGERIVAPRRSHTGAWVVGGTLIGLGVAGLLIYPATRRVIMKSVGMSPDDSGWMDTGMGGDSGMAQADTGSQMAA
ncbi:MAG TPA: hypothetical protein VK576_09495 [Thermoleophilia bacterium]|nr:hypothetical protein [Thermoleophilia bacterium]